MMDIFHPRQPLYLLSATLRDGLINCDLCPKTVPPDCWGLMDVHMEIHTSAPKTVSPGK